MLYVVVGFACFTFGFLIASIFAGSGREAMCEECRRTRS